MLVILAGAALAGGLSFLKVRWLIPAFFLAPLYGLSRVERHGGARSRLGVFAILLILAEVAVTGALTVRVTGASLFRRPYPADPEARVPGPPAPPSGRPCRFRRYRAMVLAAAEGRAG
jgi:hypothetical protein